MVVRCRRLGHRVYRSSETPSTTSKMWWFSAHVPIYKVWAPGARDVMCRCLGRRVVVSPMLHLGKFEDDLRTQPTPTTPNA